MSIWQVLTQILKYYRHLRLENCMCSCICMCMLCMCMYMHMYIYPDQCYAMWLESNHFAWSQSKTTNTVPLLFSSIDIMRCTASIIFLRRLIEFNGPVCILTASVSRDRENSLNRFWIQNWWKSMPEIDSFPSICFTEFLSESFHV